MNPSTLDAPILDFLSDPHVSQESKAALSTPHQFLKPQQRDFLSSLDAKHRERRQFREVPVQHSAFSHLTQEVQS